MRIGLWIALVVVGALFLMSAFPWIFSREFRDSSRGREFRLIIAVLGLLLALIVFNLLKGPAPGAAP